MEVMIKCPCGWEVRGTEDKVAEEGQKHGREVHKMELTREQVLAQAVPVQ